MLDIRFVREHPDEVKENIKKKFQDAKLPLVDEVINLDAEYRAAIGEGDTLRANRNKLSKQIGMRVKASSSLAGFGGLDILRHKASAWRTLMSLAMIWSAAADICSGEPRLNSALAWPALMSPVRT